MMRQKLLGMHNFIEDISKYWRAVNDMFQINGV